MRRKRTNSKGLTFFALIAGAGIGSVYTWQLLKRKHELIAQEEIDSVKAAYAERKIVEETEKNFMEGFRDDLKVAEDKTSKDEDDMDFKKYASITQKEGYTDYSKAVEEKKGTAFVEKPYVISSEELGGFEEYEKISFTYHADEVLADEDDEEIGNVDKVVGKESLNHFGEYEDDSVSARSGRLKCDYEILLDQGNYSDVVKTMPHRMGEQWQRTGLMIHILTRCISLYLVEDIQRNYRIENF